MSRFLFTFAGAILVGALGAAPAFAAPATAWEDSIFSGTPITSAGGVPPGGGPHGMVTGGEDMFGDRDDGSYRSNPLYAGAEGNFGHTRSPVNLYTPYVPNYVAPSAYYAPPPTVIIIER